MSQRLTFVIALISFIAHSSSISSTVAAQPRTLDRPAHSSGSERGIEGFWEGVVRDGERAERLLLKISRADDGALFARIDSPDTGQMDIPVDTITFEPPALHFEVEWAHAVYDGTLAANGAEISGRQQMGGDADRLIFKRTDDPAALSTRWPDVMQPEPIRARLDALRKKVAAGNRGALAAFWREVTAQGTPLMEPIAGDPDHVLLTFLWRAGRGTRNVVLMSETDHSDPAETRMTRLPGSDVWYRSCRVAADLRFTYEFSPNDSLAPWAKRDTEKEFAPDPLNPHTINGVGSAVELPQAAPQPWLKPQAAAPLGRVRRHSIDSRFLKQRRDLWVYTPPGYRTRGERYALLLLFDGPLYVVIIPTPTILDNLLFAGKIPPLVAVNVSSSERARDREMGCNAPFENFLTRELLPWVRQRYHVTTEPGGTAVGGASLGGFAATYAALRHPEIFGNVLSQGAPFGFNRGCGPPTEWLRAQFAVRPRLPLRFYLEVGALETDADAGSGLNQIQTNERLRSVLRDKGYTVFYRETRGGHNPFNWRGGMAEGLLALFGRPKPNLRRQ